MGWIQIGVRGRWGGNGRSRRRKTIIRICYMRESKSNFKKRKIKKEERHDGINPEEEFHQENSRERVCP